MQIQAGLVRVNYSNPPEPDFVAQVKCPTGALQIEEVHRKLEAFKPAAPAPKPAAPAPKPAAPAPKPAAPAEPKKEESK